MNHKKMSRREFLTLSAIGVAGLILPAGNPSRRASQSKTNPISSYKEAPGLARQVASGSFKPVEQRLPTNPLVLTPINSIGKYSTGMRTLSYWQGNSIAEYMYGHSPLRWTQDGNLVSPGLCDTWSTNGDNTEWNVHLRQGLKWSDGEPCTVDDILYWWEDLVNYNNHEAVPDFGVAGGQLAQFIKIDDYTLQMKYTVSAPLTSRRLAMWVNGCIGPRWIAPKHYLMQFHPKYNPAMPDLSLHDQKIIYYQNLECPSLNSWILTSYQQNVQDQWARNPYYYAVDPDGNQLPYIAGIDNRIVSDHDLQMKYVTNGSVDFFFFTSFNLWDISELAANQTQGRYNLLQWDSGSGTGMIYYWNHDHPEDKRRELYRNPKFKQAMSFAINRARIQAQVYAGFGTPTTGTMSPKAVEFRFNDEAKALYQQARTAYLAYDPDKARSLLDEINVKDVDGDGWREFPDGSKLEVRIDIPEDASAECMSALEITKPNWETVGLNIVINQIPPGDFAYMWRSGQGEIKTNWEASDGPDHLLYPSWVVPNEPERWAPLCGNLMAVKGTPLEDTECGADPWSLNPPRFCSTDPRYVGSAPAALHQLYEQAVAIIDDVTRFVATWDIINIHINQGPFFIGTVGDCPHIFIASSSFRNVPTRSQLYLGGFCSPWIVPYPAITNPETYYVDDTTTQSIPDPTSQFSLAIPADLVSYILPANTFDQPVTFSHTALPIAFLPENDLPLSRNALLAFEVQATDSGGQPVAPQGSYQVQVVYTDFDLEIHGVMDENSLAFYYWDGSSWKREPSSVVNPALKTITAHPDHFSNWVVMGNIYLMLPFVSKK